MRLRFVLLLLLFPLIVVIAASACSSPDEAQNAACLVPMNYLEATEENDLTLLKVLAMAHSPASLLDGDQGFSSYFMMLSSTRHYYEDQHELLPACARELNLAYIELVAAAQDVLSLNRAWHENPEVQRYENRVAQAIEHFDVKFSELAQLKEMTSPAAEPQ